MDKRGNRLQSACLEWKSTCQILLSYALLCSILISFLHEETVIFLKNSDASCVGFFLFLAEKVMGGVVALVLKEPNH